MNKRIKRIGFTAMVAVIIALALAACSNPSGGGGGGNGGTPPPPLYIITGSGTSFTATRGGVAIPDGSGVTITNLMTAIRSHAEGANVTIQFGDGSDALNIVSAFVTFAGWPGLVTLTGSITSAGTLTITTSASNNINSSANITNTSTNNIAAAIQNQSNATVSITGGTVSANAGSAIVITDSSHVNILGGTITSANTDSADRGTIRVHSTAGTLTINGGTVLNTSDGQAIIVNGTVGERVKINGGTITPPYTP